MNLRSLLILVPIAALVIGCKSGDAAATNTPATDTPPVAAAATPSAPSGNSIVGTWTNDEKDTKDTVVEFKDDGTLSLTGTDPKGIKAEGTASYKLDGDKMTMKVTSLKLIAPEGADEKVKKDVDDTNKAMTADTLNKMPQDVSTIAWKDKDTFTTTNVSGGTKGKVTTFKRKV